MGDRKWRFPWSLFLNRVRSDVPLLPFKLRVMKWFSSFQNLGDVMTGVHLLVTTFRCLKSFSNRLASRARKVVVHRLSTRPTFVCSCSFQAEDFDCDVFCFVVVCLFESFWRRSVRWRCRPISSAILSWDFLPVSCHQNDVGTFSVYMHLL